MASSSTSFNSRGQQQVPLWLQPFDMFGQILEQAGKSLRFGQNQQNPAQSWVISSEQRTRLSFGKGEVSKMLDVIDDLAKHSPAAAMALADFIAVQESPYSVEARRKLALLKSLVTPAQQAVTDAARELDQTTGLSLDERSTLQLTLLELQYLRLVNGSPIVSIGTLMGDLETLADGLAAHPSIQRQAVARTILADLLQHRSQPQAANKEMAKALVLMSRLNYGNKELLKLAEEIHGGIGDLTLPQPQQAKQSVGAQA